MLIGTSSGDFHTDPEDCYRQIYYEALDFVVQAVSDRFDQTGYRVYQNLQELPLTICKGHTFQDQLEAVLDNNILSTRMIFHGLNLKPSSHS